jgi:hypothetical protein
MKTSLSIFLLLISVSVQASPASEQALASYLSQGAGPFSAEAGKRIWLSVSQDTKSGADRSCTNCHGSDLTLPGKHNRTGKPIEPMNPSISPQRLSEGKKIEKWFKRNCKWTLGRECTPQEKGDLILFIQQ